MRIAVVTSRGCKYPSLRFPQYLDQDSCFDNLSAKVELFLIGNILEPRTYATSQLSFTRILNKLPLVWNNRYATFLSTAYPIEKLREKLDSFSDMLYSRDCFDYLLNNEVDVIYSFPWPFDRYILKWAKELSKPLVIEMWEDYSCFSYMKLTSLGLPKSTISQEIRRSHKWMLDLSQGADRIIVPTGVFADILKRIGVEANKIRVVPVCVDDSSSTSLIKIKPKHDLKNEETIVFYIGSLSPWHDLSTLIKSIKFVKSKFVFIIAGGRNKKLEKLADHYSSSSVRVIFPGKLEPKEVNSYLSLADICIALYRFPQPSGFFPAKIIRYMLAGKPIVATITPEIKEMFRGEEAGILIPREDCKSLAHVLDHLATSSQERLRLGSNAKKIAQNNYLTQNHTEQLLEVFKEVMRDKECG